MILKSFLVKVALALNAINPPTSLKIDNYKPQFYIAHKGDAAPFDGVLYNKDANSVILSEKSNFSLKLELKLKHQKELLMMRHQQEISELILNHEKEKSALTISFGHQRKQFDAIISKMEKTNKSSIKAQSSSSGWIIPTLIGIGLGALVVGAGAALVLSK